MHLFYVGVESPEIAKQRIKDRVSRGGHGIPDEVVDKRYSESLENLKKIIKMFDYITIYDNTKNFKIIFSISKVEARPNLKIIYRSDNLPNWIKNIVKNKIMKE